ncbi:hypothetical protein WJX84_002019 [Apatococcus fuscideae]|uniref:ABC transporter domain-containing protein n=1 Tax=Apatococcus fuscideae TaxID=2026836 RepID=A0AAW1TB66_9CHLO
MSALLRETPTEPGRLLALMGPSGSGKTTLLNALAGQVPASAKLTLQGRINVNGVPQQKSSHAQGYVQQEDVFFSQLTVRETLSLAAELRLGVSQSTSHSQNVVDDILKRLGLTASADTVVGDAKTRGLSGGEKKRLSIACELIGSPLLLFADEPTTGLDSFQAEKVMQTLKDLAAAGHTVVTSIHQPRSSIFTMFDDVLLLTEGGCVYHGPAASALEHFSKQGFECPERYNPAEFLADLISVDYSSTNSENKTRGRVDKLLDAWAKGGGQHLPETDQSSTDSEQGQSSKPSAALQQPSQQQRRRGCSKARQVRLLLGRSWKQILRDRYTNVSRVLTNVNSAAVFGAIFWQLKRTQTSIQDRMGLLQVCAINTAMSSLIKTLNVFPTERVVVERERSKRSYAIAPYFVSKLIAESPIGAMFPLLFGSIVYPAAGLHQRASRFLRFMGLLTLESFVSSSLGLAVGAVAPSTEAALAMGPAVILIFVVFGGYYVNDKSVPRALQWIPRTSFIKHGFSGLCANELRGLTFDKDDKADVNISSGQQALQRVGFGDASPGGSARAMGRILLFNYWVTYCILKSKRPKFQPLEAPAA